MKKNILLLLFFCSVLLCGKEIFVDYSCKTNGDGTVAKPFCNFAAAIKIACPGDTIKIVPVDFEIPDSIVIRNFSGSKDKPLTVDGSFNTFTGLDKAKERNWKQISPGLWKRDIRLSKGVSQRYFMVINGKMERMGRFIKAKCPVAYKKVDELKNNQWTIIADQQSKVKNSFLFSIYLRIDPRFSSPAEAGVFEPRVKPLSGVDISGKCTGIVIKNIICRNFWNDGFNIHNDVTATTFDTICAIDCGDDGISAHENCEISVKNFLSFGNSTGICHIDKAVCRHSNIYIENALGRDIYLKAVADNATHNTFKNVWVNSSSAGGVVLGAGAGYIDVDNMTVVLTSRYSSFIHPAFRGGKSRISRLYILCSKTGKMTMFKKSLLEKFQGKVDHQLLKR